MGVIAAALALAFMHFHWALKKAYLRFGLHVRPPYCHASVLSAPTQQNRGRHYVT